METLSSISKNGTNTYNIVTVLRTLKFNSTICLFVESLWFLKFVSHKLSIFPHSHQLNAITRSAAHGAAVLATLTYCSHHRHQAPGPGAVPAAP